MIFHSRAGRIADLSVSCQTSKPMPPLAIVSSTQPRSSNRAWHFHPSRLKPEITPRLAITNEDGRLTVSNLPIQPLKPVGSIAPDETKRSGG